MSKLTKQLCEDAIAHEKIVYSDPDKLMDALRDDGPFEAWEEAATPQVVLDLLERIDVLESAASNFLKDLEERVERDGKYYPSESVRDYLGNGKTLPVGNGVLFMLDEALKDDSDD